MTKTLKAAALVVLASTGLSSGISFFASVQGTGTASISIVDGEVVMTETTGDGVAGTGEVEPRAPRTRAPRTRRPRAQRPARPTRERGSRRARGSRRSARFESVFSSFSF